MNTPLSIAGSDSIDEAGIRRLLDRLHSLRGALGQVIVGQDKILEELMVVLLAGGHGLLEGVPGLAKTLMVRTLAQAVDLDFRRIQFTPDLMPTDILGTEVLDEDPETGRRHFRFEEGPVFTHLLLADEINRTPPKTQSALLEAMQELEVTHGGRTYTLQRPFFVLATQNPIEQAGTYPLPEAQLDRFLLHLRIDYPSEAEEKEILAATTGGARPEVEPVIRREEILELQALVRQVSLSEPLLDYVTRLIRCSRPADSPVQKIRDYVDWGAGPRAGQALILAGKARALLHGRFAVNLEDLRSLILPVFRHRLLLGFRGQAERLTADEAAGWLLDEVALPESPLA